MCAVLYCRYALCLLYSKGSLPAVAHLPASMSPDQQTAELAVQHEPVAYVKGRHHYEVPFRVCNITRA